VTKKTGRPSKAGYASRARAAPAPAADEHGALPRDDVNLTIASALLDLASVQDGERQRHAYTRAAYAVLGTEHPLSARLHDGTLEKIRYVGPSSERVILEILGAGTSPTVTAAVERSGKRTEVERRRGLRDGFLSQSVAEWLLAARLDGVIDLADYRGDFQMHSVFSDGDQTLDEIVRACMALGYTCAAITDHSYGLPVARGMSMEAAARQHEEIDALNAQFAGRFRMYKGVEANILPDGSLDLSEEERRRFEIVVASPHSGLRSASDQTDRMIAAVSLPHVHILGHPRGRKFNARPGVTADWSRVFAAAARHGVAIEIDGSIERQDVDAGLAAQAVAAGCLIALDSDAHAPLELVFARMAIAHARLARIPPGPVVNCWTDAQLEAWCRDPAAGGGSIRS
jgi:histidinol phosphatase-like PHP family hydrolase